MRISLAVMSVLLAGLVLAADAPVAGAPAGGRAQRVEEFGVRAFRRDYFGALKVTPFACDRTLAEGAGHSLVTRTGDGVDFDPAWVADGVEFVAFRIHKNPVAVTPEAFFPAVLGSRYARVVRVIDARNLVVNFEFNGGSAETPKVSERASGYFFIDCAPALRRMVAAPDRPDILLFESGACYVSKGLPNIPFLAREQTRDMRWRATQPGRRARIKLSAEDALGFRSRGAASALPDGAFFALDAHDRSLYLEDIDLIGPTYSVPVVEEGWDGVMFSFANGPCARTLEIRNCNTFAEKAEVEKAGAALPAGATWVAPGITGIVGGGGRRGDRGDGVVDIIGHQRFNLIRSTWVARCIHSIKNNDGAGNWITIDGIDLDAEGGPVNCVYEAMYVKRNRFEGVTVSFHDFAGAGARRGVRAESPDFSWRMLTNQYWTGGTSTSSTETVMLDIDGFRLHFGNNGDWWREAGKSGGPGGCLNAAEAALFDRIPLPGDRIPLERTPEGAWRTWGWGAQTGDVLTVNGRDFEIATRKRMNTAGPVLGAAMPAGTAGYAHYWELSFKPEAPAGDRIEAVVKTSRTAHLLDGKPRKANLVYDRDLHGHWQYNRAEVNYEFRNIRFNGYYRQTAGPAANAPEYQGLWELPVKQEWVNCHAMATDGSAAGVPAEQIGSEAFGKTVLRLRNVHPQSLTRDHHILVDGGRLFAQRLRADHSPVWIRNRPTLIYGTASFGEPRLCNPVLLDDKGVVCPSGLAVSLVGGHSVDLSRSVIGDPAGKAPQSLWIYGNGTARLDGVQLLERPVGQRSFAGAVHTLLANGLEKDRFALHLRGKGGMGGFRLEGAPEDGSVKLEEWDFRQPLFAPRRFNVSPGWQALPGFAEKVTIDGRPGGAPWP